MTTGGRPMFLPAEAVTIEPTTVSSELGDDELMLLARDGVAGAFDTLVRRHQVRVFEVARRYVGEPALAADVTQETFVGLLRAVHNYRPLGKFRAFLFRMVLNHCRMANRSARAAARVERFLWTDEQPDGSAMLAREQLRDIERELAGLSTKLRQAVLLRHSADMSYQEIAETLDIPLGTAKRRVCVAMLKLREALGEP